MGKRCISPGQEIGQAATDRGRGAPALKRSGGSIAPLELSLGCVLCFSLGQFLAQIHNEANMLCLERNWHR